MKSRLICYFILFVYSRSVVAQNLILNGSFEETDTTRNTTTILELAYPWRGQAVKLLSTDASYDETMIPLLTKPADGKNMVSVTLGNHNLVGEFSQRLVKGHTYELRFFYYPHSGKMDKNFQIDYCFADNMTDRGNAPYAVNKELICYEFYPLKKNKWHEFKKTFIAKGNEKYLVIWNMKMKKTYTFYFDNFYLNEINISRTIKN